MKKIIKKSIMILITGIIATSLVACSNTNGNTKGILDTNISEIQGDFCPGKELGPEGQPMTLAEGFDTTVDMSFKTVDTNGNPVTNEIFAGSEHGVYLIFWQTDNDKTIAELEKLNSLVDVAKEHKYKIVGVVMDGEKNSKKAKDIAKDLKFQNIIWNKEVASRYVGVEDFFSEEFHEANKENFSQFSEIPKVDDPVSTLANSRGQVQSSFVLVPMDAEKIEEMIKNNDSNATYEELLEQERAGK